MLLKHLTPDVQLVSTADYTPALADDYNAVVLIGNDAESPVPMPVLVDLRNSQTPVLWMGYGFSELGALEGERLGFEPGFWTDQHLPSGIAYGNTTYPAQVADYSQVGPKPASTPIVFSPQVVDATPASVRVVAEYTSEGPSGMAVPSIIQSGNVWYANLLPSFESTSSPRAVPTLILADVLHEFLDEPGDTHRPESLVRLSGLTLSSDPQRLDAMSNEFQQRHMPFVIGIRPGVALALQSRPDLVDALRHAQSRGGLIAEEFDDDSQAEAAYDALDVLGIAPRLSVGTASIFSHVITNGSMPYPVKDNEHVFISSDLGSGDVATQLTAAQNLLAVRDAWAVAVQDVNDSDDNLAQLLDGLSALGYAPANFVAEPFAIRAETRPTVTDRLSEWATVEWPILGSRFNRGLSLAMPYWAAIRDSPWQTIVEVLFVLGFLFRLREQWRPASEAESQSLIETASPVAGKA